MLRKILSVAITVICVLSLTSCGRDKGYVRLFGEKIPEGVYNYYYAEALKQGGDAEAAAEYKIKSYIATGRLIEKAGATLSANRKRMVAEETEKQWSLFSAYYEKAGVSKQALTQINTCEMSKKELVHFYYGAGGKNEVSQETLRSEFAKKYMMFKAVEASFLTLNDVGENIEMADSEKKALRSSFSAMAKKVNGGADIDSVNESYNESIGLIVTQPLSLTVIKENDPIYGKEFFSQVAGLSYGEAAVLENGSSIYMLQRVRADSDEETFSLYAAEVLEDMKMASIEKKIKKIMDEF